MNYKKNKYYNFKNKPLLVSIFLIILIFSLIGTVSAVELDDTDNSNTNVILQSKEISNSDLVQESECEIKLKEASKSEKISTSANSVHNISSTATNDDIQTIFDNSNEGDTIQFNDKTYNNISIVVNKKLNIVSTKNSIIKTSDSISSKANEMGIANSFGFYFTSLASGSVLKGLTLTGNSDYEIIVEGANNISIVNNSISGGKKAGILLNNSKYDIIKGNDIKGAFKGIVTNNVNRTSIAFNKIHSNRNTGLVLENVLLVNLTNNTIYKNGLDGVLLKYAKNCNLLNNSIVNNTVSGLRMEGNTTRNKIKFNNISSNAVNIYANSLTNGDEISQNTLMFAKQLFGTYVSDENTGAAIVFADNYEAARAGTMFFGYNSVGMNEIWDAKSTMTHPPVEIAPNWYFDNDGNYAIGHICPMVFGRSISVEDLKSMSMGFSVDGDGVFGQLFADGEARGAGKFTIDNVNVNGKDYGSFEVDESGRINLNLDDLPAGSKITVTINGHSFTIDVDEELKSNRSSNKTENANATKAEESSEDIVKKSKKVPNDDVSSSSSTGNGTGSGSGSSRGSGSGEGNFTGSGISVGDVSGQSNAGTGDSGENGGGSASEGVNAYEILPQENTPTAAKNSQLLAVFAVALVILIIALGYRSKNKNVYEDDGEDYSL